MNYEILSPSEAALGLEKCRQQESQRIKAAVTIELEWWKEKIITDPVTALTTGELIALPDEGKNYRLIGNLRKNEEPRTVRPETARLLDLIQDRWIQETESLGLTTTNVFLSVTSLYRSFDLQHDLNRFSQLSARGISAHQAGAVIDFDPMGYYQGINRKSVTAYYSDFDIRYIQALQSTLDQLENENYCHVLKEKWFQQDGHSIIKFDACYHVCLNPISISKLSLPNNHPH